MTTREREIRDLWRGGAARLQHGVCDDCHRHRDQEGRLMTVARREHGRLFLCLACFTGRLPRRERIAA